MIRERTLCGIKAARAAGKVIGRPKKIFRRDEVVRLREVEGLSWRAIGKKLSVPVTTAMDSYRQSRRGSTSDRTASARSQPQQSKQKKRASAVVALTPLKPNE